MIFTNNGVRVEKIYHIMTLRLNLYGGGNIHTYNHIFIEYAMHASLKLTQHAA